MTVRADEAVRLVEIVATEADVPGTQAGTLVVVLDPAWTPMPGYRPDVLAARSLFGAVVERRDLFDEALERLDAWADRSRAADRLTFEGVTYWFRVRETMWRWLHERLLWRYVLASIGPEGQAVRYRIPTDEDGLREVAARLGPVDLAQESDPVVAAVEARPGAGPATNPEALWRRVVRRLRRLARAAPRPRVAPGTGGDSAVDPRVARLIERAGGLAQRAGPRIVVL